MLPYLDLKKINNKYELEFRNKFDSFIESGWYILGKEVEIFEKSFAEYLQVKNVLGVANGLDALVLVFKGYLSLGKLKIGDKVLVPANTYIASILAIELAGLVPVLIEPNIHSFNLSVDEITQNINSEVKAILIVHLYGQISEIDKIKEFSVSKNIILVEDCAQAHGAEFNKIKAGVWGHAGAFSFYPGKNLGALGDGGAISTNDDELFEKLQYLRNYGSKIKYQNDEKGLNSRLDEIQASFLNIKLKDLDNQNNIRIELAKIITSNVSNPLIRLPTFQNNGSHVYHIFAVLSENREKLKEYLNQKDIATMIHYPIPPHKQQAFKELNNLTFPITEKIHLQELSLPVNPSISVDQCLELCKVLNKYK
jgi:dTDP-4-amino-4,6-dideoxygalactose transaminase